MILRTIPALAVVHAFSNGPIPVVLTDLLSAHLRYSGIALLADQGRRVAQRVHGLQRFAVRERRIAPSCVASGIACARAVATIKRSAGSP